MNQIIKKVLLPAAKIYWRLFKPKTFGVKVLIINPKDGKSGLLVKHSYGDLTLWNLPGGGYNPTRENPLVAGIREVKEELGIDLSREKSKIIGEYKTTGEGKRDTVAIVLGVIKNSDVENEFELSNELSTTTWWPLDLFENNKEVARVAKQAIQNYLADA